MRRPRASPEPEYRLQISSLADPRARQQVTLLTLRTTKFFSNFRYALDVSERVEGRRITLKILGLHAPRLDLPASGPAEFGREYEHLEGKYTVVVEGPDGSTSELEVQVTPQAVTLLRPATGNVVTADIPPAHS